METFLFDFFTKGLKNFFCIPKHFLIIEKNIFDKKKTYMTKKNQKKYSKDKFLEFYKSFIITFGVPTRHRGADTAAALAAAARS